MLARRQSHKAKQPVLAISRLLSSLPVPCGSLHPNCLLGNDSGGQLNVSKDVTPCMGAGTFFPTWEVFFCGALPKDVVEPGVAYCTACPQASASRCVKRGVRPPPRFLQLSGNVGCSFTWSPAIAVLLFLREEGNL